MIQHALAQWRRGKGWRQIDLARRLAVDVSTVKRWERGATVPYPYHQEQLQHLGFQSVFWGTTEARSSSQAGEPQKSHSRQFRSSSSPEKLSQRSALLPAEEKAEHSSTYFVQDRSNQEEQDRLAAQDRMITTAMGGVFPEQSPTQSLRRVLDVGCGTGGWLLEVAQHSPTIISLVGVDISKTMVDYARQQAQVQHMSERVEFLTMDALRMLEFPTDFFDLVNLRLGLSFLRTWDWPKLLQECKRVARPGGVLRITETTMAARCHSPALAKLQHLFLQALAHAGHLFEEGVVAGLPHLLRQYAFRDVQTHLYELEYRAGTPEKQLFIEDLTRVFRTALPFLRKWVRVPDNYEALYRQMLADIRQPDFVAQWPLITVWGTC
jgi:ubiquinone/menaquinone biosynthesis C-methylase UbiE/transcriptional regulator with XRE-family HTH domain